jgi:hypothetical protein
MNTDKIKQLCASIVKHDDWDRLQAHLLMVSAPSSGIDTLRNALSHIHFIGENADGEFKKIKSSSKTQQPESNIDPDLNES